MDVFSPDAAPNQVAAAVAEKVEEVEQKLQEQQRRDGAILARRAEGTTQTSAKARSSAKETFQEGQTDIQKRAEAAEAEFVYDENANPEVSERTVDAMAAFWRDVLNQVDGTLFASFAKNRLGKQLINRGLPREQLPAGFKEFPGDLDAFVPDQSALEKAYKILQTLGATFTSTQDGRPFKQLPDGSLLLGGEVEIPGMIHRAKNGNVEPFKHEFEFFVQNSERVIGWHEREMRIRTDDGIWVLDDEALSRQYGRNLRMEKEVGQEDARVRQALRENETAIRTDIAFWKAVPDAAKAELRAAQRSAAEAGTNVDYKTLEQANGLKAGQAERIIALDEAYRTRYSPEEIEEFYDLDRKREEAVAAGEASQVKALEEKITRHLTGGLKNKEVKRMRDLKDLQDQRSIPPEKEKTAAAGEEGSTALAA